MAHFRPSARYSEIAVGDGSQKRKLCDYALTGENISIAVMFALTADYFRPDRPLPTPLPPSAQCAGGSVERYLLPIGTWPFDAPEHSTGPPPLFNWSDLMKAGFLAGLVPIRCLSEAKQDGDADCGQGSRQGPIARAKCSARANAQFWL